MEMIMPISHEGIVGQVVIEMPTFKERMEMMRSIKYNFDENGQITVDRSSIDLSSMAIQAFEICQERVKSVELKHEETGTMIRSIDELSMYSDGVEIMTQISNKIRSGIQLGKA